MKRGFGSMSNDNDDDIKATVYNTVEFTMVDRVSEEEVMAIMNAAKKHRIETIVSKSRRIITARADYVDEATGVLADAYVIDGVRLIKHITEYEIEKV
jgi:hypothetical protein